MAKYKKFVDGMEIADIASSEGGYNYYGYTRWGNNSQWAILREKTDQSEYRWAVGKSNYATNWTGRAGLNYKRANAFSTMNT